jgi:hypothetical protein
MSNINRQNYYKGDPSFSLQCVVADTGWTLDDLTILTDEQRHNFWGISTARPPPPLDVWISYRTHAGIVIWHHRPCINTHASRLLRRKLARSQEEGRKRETRRRQLQSAQLA